MTCLAYWKTCLWCVATTVQSTESEDCSQSLYGCCPDDITEASGPNYAGCQQKDAIPHGYCVETEFGCCPDGVTAARGPYGRGCPNVPCYVCTARSIAHLFSSQSSRCLSTTAVNFRLAGQFFQTSFITKSYIIKI